MFLRLLIVAKHEQTCEESMARMNPRSQSEEPRGFEGKKKEVEESMRGRW